MAKSVKADNGKRGQADRLVKKYTSGTYLRDLVESALEEDLGPGDVTNGIFAANMRGNAFLLAKQDGVLSGTDLVETVFRVLSRNTRVVWHIEAGQKFHKGDRLADIVGPMRVLLAGERVALNFLQRMCGIATMTGKFVEIIGKGKNRPGIYDTRKTTPLLRAFEKKAVTDGGGRNHRFALYDMAMLKNNHIDAAGSIVEAVEQLRASGFDARRLGLCIEARTAEEAVEATWCRADVIMLDNMTPAQIKAAAEKVTREAKAVGAPLPELEISGGITLKNIARYADLPVQRISIGALTHSAPALDISMRYED